MSKIAKLHYASYLLVGGKYTMAECQPLSDSFRVLHWMRQNKQIKQNCRAQALKAALPTQVNSSNIVPVDEVYVPTSKRVKYTIKDEGS